MPCISLPIKYTEGMKAFGFLHINLSFNFFLLLTDTDNAASLQPPTSTVLYELCFCLYFCHFPNNLSQFLLSSDDLN